MKKIRKTYSVCPICIKKIKADIIEKDNKVFMLKACKGHGRFNILLSKYNWYYKNLHGYYFNLFSNRPESYSSSFLLYLTFRCNLNCPICYEKTNDINYQEPTISYIKKVLNKMKGQRILLFGGEPTIRKDLNIIIKLIVKSKNIPSLITNGIKLADFNYAKSLKKAGLDTCLLQFDGFRRRTNIILRGKDIVKYKIEAIENLKKLKIPTILEVTVAKNINDNELIDILNFALCNNSVRRVTFRTYAHMGNRKLSKNNSLTNDEIIDILEKNTSGVINKIDVINFTKTLYSLKSCFESLPIDACPKTNFLLLYKGKDNFENISNILNLNRVQKNLEKYKGMVLENKKLAKPYLISALSLKLFSINKLKKLIPLIKIFFLDKIMKKKATLKNLSSRFLLISFNNTCDPYTFDYSIASRCPNQEITSEGIKEHRGINDIERERAIQK